MFALRYFPQRNSNCLTRWPIFLLPQGILSFTQNEYLNFCSGYLTFTTYTAVATLYHGCNPFIFILGWLCIWVASQNYCPFAALSHPHPLLLCSKHLKHTDSYQLPGSVCVASGFNSTHRKEIFSTEIYSLCCKPIQLKGTEQFICCWECVFYFKTCLR